MKRCQFCINKESCNKCDRHGNKFIPEDRVKKYFSSYNGRYDETIDKYVYEWHWNSTNEKLVPTQSIVLDNDEYCPYCGERMFPIQDKKSLEHIGRCCICKGAEAELQYKEDEMKLLEEHKNQLEELRNGYKDKLKYDSKKIFEKKQELERKRFEWSNKDNSYRCNYFSTINGRKLKTSEDVVEW